jgi:hypothetical protein
MPHVIRPVLVDRRGGFSTMMIEQAIAQLGQEG